MPKKLRNYMVTATFSYVSTDAHWKDSKPDEDTYHWHHLIALHPELRILNKK
jgi:hypothetical protein